MLRRLFFVIAALATIGFAPQPASADYWGRWDRVGGGWTTGWIRHPGFANVCGHQHPGCNCQGRSYCGSYPNGAVTIWCPQGPNTGPVWQIRCSIQPIAGGGAGHTQRYQNPTMHGAVVDWCAPWAQNCGWGGAHTFCRAVGYARAVDFSTYRPGRTWVMITNRYCNFWNCVGFAHVTCAR